VISVITINYNNKEGLAETIKSVISQSYREIEYIVIDGGSNDGSVDVIKQYAGHISFWASEKDHGIYHAMNKGIQKATGEYLLFLNSGDYLSKEDSLHKIATSSNGEAIIYGDLIVKTSDSSWIKTLPSTLSFDFFLKDCLPHSATLIKKALFDQAGLYNEQNKIVSDWEFFMNVICKFNADYKHIGEPISVFMEDGISSHPKNEQLILQEKEKVLQQYVAFLPDYKLLNELKSELNLIKLSRLHRFANRIANSSMYKFLVRNS
jgi:glycosyltransferase involved in cell wall biosynthesis